MKRGFAVIALLASSCTTMEPRYVRPDPAIPASWPVGDAYLTQAEAGLPALTYAQVFQDSRLQTLVAQALLNNRDLMVAASNIAAARERYRIQRADLLPTLDAGAGATITGAKDNYTLGLNVPNFEIDLFGRLRSLTHSQLEQYFATEAGARSTRLTLVSAVASAWLDHAADASLVR